MKKGEKMTAEQKAKLADGKQRAREAKKKEMPAYFSAPDPMPPPAAEDRLATALESMSRVLTSFNARLDAMEQRQLGVIRTATNQPVPTKERHGRCEQCNEIFRFPDTWKEGDGWLCQDCREHKKVQTRCSHCNMPAWVLVGERGPDVKCKVCKDCPICDGTRRQGVQVCRRCIQGNFDVLSQTWINSHRNEVCEGCGCLAGHNDSYCKKCRADFNQKNAGAFRIPENTIPQDQLITDAGTTGHFDPTLIRQGAARQGEFAGVAGPDGLPGPMTRLG